MRVISGMEGTCGYWLAYSAVTMCLTKPYYPILRVRQVTNAVDSPSQTYWSKSDTWTALALHPTILHRVVYKIIKNCETVPAYFARFNLSSQAMNLVQVVLGYAF